MDSDHGGRRVRQSGGGLPGQEVNLRTLTWSWAQADVVASANPGCAMHLGAAGVPTVHPMTLVAEALGVSGSSGQHDAR